MAVFSPSLPDPHWRPGIPYTQRSRERKGTLHSQQWQAHSLQSTDLCNDGPCGLPYTKGHYSSFSLAKANFHLLDIL